MSKLNTIIPIKPVIEIVQGSNIDIARRVLKDIAAALPLLVKSAAVHVIDLKQLPRMTPATYQYLKDALSTGEVSAVVNADVVVEIQETRYPGVWWLTHLNEKRDIMTEMIEISMIPSILKPHRVEILEGQKRLDELIKINSVALQSEQVADG